MQQELKYSKKLTPTSTAYEMSMRMLYLINLLPSTLLNIKGQ